MNLKSNKQTYKQEGGVTATIFLFLKREVIIDLYSNLQEDIERVLRLGVEPSRIVYSHTRKQRSYLSYASKLKVDLMTFDDEAELLKIKEIFPEARWVIMIFFYSKELSY